MDLDLMMQHVSFYYKPKDDKGDELPLAENWAEGLMPASWAEFELGTQLGHGRQAVVCVARYKGQSFAVKRSVTSGSKTNRNIARELYLLSRLRPHPNVIAIHGGGVTPEGHLFMMLQLGFLSVTAQLQKQQPPLANDICSPLSIAWLRVLRDSARGMAHVHGCGIVHRDLSCDNVILLAPLEDPGCRAVISDFGVAQELRDSSRLVRGACRKYPPEAMGATQDYLPASDVFMFACLVYEVLCGRVYFAELSTADACSATLRGSRPKLPDTPALARLVRLVTHCWAQDHRRRPTFLQIAEELDGLCSAA
jgi:serine/threonine protein kinase